MTASVNGEIDGKNASFLHCLKRFDQIKVCGSRVEGDKERKGGGGGGGGGADRQADRHRWTEREREREREREVRMKDRRGYTDRQKDTNKRSA